MERIVDQLEKNLNQNFSLVDYDDVSSNEAALNFLYSVNKNYFKKKLNF